MLRTVLLIILILMLIGALPMWPYTQGWHEGWRYGSPGLLVILIILVLLLV